MRGNPQVERNYSLEEYIEVIDRAIAQRIYFGLLPDNVDETVNSTSYVTKDSGKRQVYSTGMQRDTNEGKARFDLLIPEGVPYKDQFLTRVAELMARGAQKYNDRNWEKAATPEELARFKESAFRHFMQWICGDPEEDHASAIVFNVLAYETTRYKMEKEVTGGEGGGDL